MSEGTVPMENLTMATQDHDAGSAPAPLPEALRAALARVQDPLGQKALTQAFAALLAERDRDRERYRQREWKLFGALDYALKIGQIVSYEDFEALTDFSQWSPPA